MGYLCVPLDERNKSVSIMLLKVEESRRGSTLYSQERTVLSLHSWLYTHNTVRS
jgi:hypothetical protein